MTDPILARAADLLEQDPEIHNESEAIGMALSEEVSRRVHAYTLRLIEALGLPPGTPTEEFWVVAHSRKEGVAALRKAAENP
ncbi:MAG: hypothetical protein KGJ23_08785 [Euryarchaeota archaeon]|nr:hypothetical protein [Euryarchaeota archaeon]MDE1836699.1 hypothetical protein [Euryarchaeota archaeon]MDE1880272.1 hypothetical protein [Euryarchaeota archaeon]MDE2044669.1 hypothetical protein [Thermoplasmata archaeon]